MNAVAVALGVLMVSCVRLLHAADVSVSDGNLVFQGLIDEASWRSVQEQVHGQSVRRLVITSKGGDVETALQFAKWIFHNGIDVEVPDHCFSSCANYIFLAGVHKFITGQGVVGWHGNASQLLYLVNTGVEKIPAESLPTIQSLATEEADYFSEIRVDQFLCWVGTVAPFSVKNAYILSAEDMSYFGLSNLIVRDDYVRSDLSKWNSETPGKLVYLKLDRKVVEAIRPPGQ